MEYLEDSGISGFISYSHDDAICVNKLRDDLEILRESGDLKLWYDREIEPGTKWESEIEEKLNASRLVVFCITNSFLSSKACREEFRKAIELKKNENAEIVLIILEESDWKDDKEISDYQAVPEYGTPVSQFANSADAYVQIREAIARKVNFLKRRLRRRFSDTHQKLLQAMDSLLVLSGSECLGLNLEDVYVDPELQGRHEDGVVTDAIPGASLLDMLIDGKKILISGESQSGKTSLCRWICQELFKRHYLPVYVDSRDGYTGSLNKQIGRFLQEQYTDADCVQEDRRVLILDDFYKCKRPESYLSSLPKCCSVLVVLDDVYDLNMKNAMFFKEYDPFRILPMRARKRTELIRKWLRSQNKEGHEPFDNYKSQDKLSARVESTLGKMFGKGLIPAYPFYILSILITTEIAAKPLNQEISSQGYCYQSLLYAVLHRLGVRNQHVDMYVNFLTELAYMLFKTKNAGKCTDEELASFARSYQDKFTLTLPLEGVYENLNKGHIFGRDSLGYFDRARDFPAQQRWV